MPTLRHADPDTASRYPLPIRGAAAWQPAARPGGAPAWRLQLPLAGVGPGTILVPSLASSATRPRLDAAGEPLWQVPRHQWRLRTSAGAWWLQEVPAAVPSKTSRRGDPVSTHVDCYHVHRQLGSAELEVTVDGQHPPERYLVCVSARPLTMADPPTPSGVAALAEPPAPRSQMTAPEVIASRICSPTCVSMVLGLWNRSHDWLTLTAECHDPVSGMYGVWPLALAAAARRGCLGAVETFRDWDEPLAVLRRGVPLVTSIRFASGELPGAPLPETSGHLVVVHGVSPDSVAVCDPAANDGEVLRSYPAAAFTRAWLRHRGAAYILPP